MLGYMEEIENILIEDYSAFLKEKVDLFNFNIKINYLFNELNK